MTLKDLRQKRQGRHGAHWPRRRGSQGRHRVRRPWWLEPREMPTSRRTGRIIEHYRAACSSSCCLGDKAPVWSDEWWPL